MYKKASNEKKNRNLVNREAKKAKEERLNNNCKYIDFYITKGLSDKTHKNIKWFFNEYKDKTTILRGADGKVITGGKNKLKLWKQYIEKLNREFETALKELKHNKATGIDKVSGEMLKALEGQGKETLSKIIYEIYEKGLIHKDFKKCLMIPILKKKEILKM